MENRFKPEKRSKKESLLPYGPVVTISRMYGCPAKRIAAMLTSAINQIVENNKSQEKWTLLGKEILEQSAKELHLKPDLIKEIANTHGQGLIDDILLSFTNKYYPGDIKVKHTIGDIINEYAIRGKVVMVGRGGVALLRDVKKSVHIKITAPLEWRINDVSKRYMITLDEAERRIKEIDLKRDHLRKFFAGKKIDDSVFDIIFNYYTCTEEEIISCTIKLMEKRDMI